MKPGETLNGRLSRRDAISWMLAATGAITLMGPRVLAQRNATPGNQGYGVDPDMLRGGVPWERSMTSAQLALTARLADIILPHVDASSPGASEVNVPDFFDEWVSAPYPDQQRDREIIIPGLDWMNAEARRRFNQDFCDLVRSKAEVICDDICHEADARPEHRQGARFFALFRKLTLGGYYTTSIGMKDVGYVGNVPMVSFDGPPPEVMKRLGIEKQPW